MPNRQTFQPYDQKQKKTELIYNILLVKVTFRTRKSSYLANFFLTGVALNFVQRVVFKMLDMTKNCNRLSSAFHLRILPSLTDTAALAPKSETTKEPGTNTHGDDQCDIPGHSRHCRTLESNIHQPPIK